MRRIADLVIIAAAAAFFAIGTALTVAGPLATGRAGPPSGSGPCARATDALHSACRADVPATVVGSSVTVDSGGLAHPLVSVRPAAVGEAPLTVEVPSAVPGSELGSGQPAVLTVAGGRPTAITTASGRLLPTVFDPSSAQPLQLEGGMSLMGLSALILLVRPRAHRMPRAHTLSDPGTGSARAFPVGEPARRAIDILRSPSLMGTFGAFVLLQALDGATSVAGGPAGLLEGNRLAGTVASSVSPVLGYAAMKSAAVIVMFLAMTRLPRSAALLAAGAGSAMMAAVVANNLLLLSR